MPPEPFYILLGAGFVLFGIAAGLKWYDDRATRFANVTDEL
jgi:hypothetical protein